MQTFLLLPAFWREQMWLGSRRPSQEHFSYSRTIIVLGSTGLFLAVRTAGVFEWFSTPSAIFIGCVQLSHCQACKWTAVIAPVLTFFTSCAREHKGKNSYIRERECKQRKYLSSLLFVCLFILYWEKLQKRTRYFNFQPEKPEQRLLLENLMGGTISELLRFSPPNPQHRSYGHATESCVTTAYIDTC